MVNMAYEFFRASCWIDCLFLLGVEVGFGDFERLKDPHQQQVHFGGVDVYSAERRVEGTGMTLMDDFIEVLSSWKDHQIKSAEWKT